MRGAWLVIGACFSPHPPGGVTCADNGDCPSGLHCVALTNTCEATDPQPGTDGGADAPPDGASSLVDGPPDGPLPRDCWPAWRGGAPNLSTPVALSQLNTAADEVHPWLSGDGLTLYFAQGAGAAAQLLIATRPARDQPFGAAVLATDLNSTVQDSGVALDASGLVAILASTRAGGTGGEDLWQATRASTADPFDAAVHPPLASVDTTAAELDPELTGNGLRLYYAEEALSETIQLASRANLADAFGAPAPLTIAGAPATDTSNPRVSPDELTLIFASGAGQGVDIYIATRATTQDNFTVVGPAPVINTTAQEIGEALPADGCEIVFASNRAGGSGSDDLYYSTVLP